MTASAPGPSSALVWITRRTDGDDDDLPFRATRADEDVELRAVDADHVGAGIVVTPREVRGQVTVDRAAITAIGCAAVSADRWELVAVAGARRAIGHGTPASIAALARELARELAVPYVDHGVALTPPVPPRWSVVRPDEQLVVSYNAPTTGLIIVVPIAALVLGGALDLVLGLGDAGFYACLGLAALAMWRIDAARALRRHRQQVVVLDRVGLQLRAGGVREVIPLEQLERFVPRPTDAGLATVAAICDGRELELITARDPRGRAVRAIATRLNVELDRLRVGDAHGRR